MVGPSDPAKEWLEPERDSFKISYTESHMSMGLPHVQRFKKEKTYFLLGFIPIWHVSEEHNVYDPYPNRFRDAENME